MGFEEMVDFLFFLSLLYSFSSFSLFFLGCGSPSASALCRVVISLVLCSTQIQGLVGSTPDLSTTYPSPLTTRPPGSDDVLRVWDCSHSWSSGFTLMRCDFSYFLVCSSYFKSFFFLAFFFFGDIFQEDFGIFSPRNYWKQIFQLPLYIVINSFNFLPGHTSRLHFPASLAVVLAE